MKKKICLIITLIISLFAFSSRVGAAKELTCVYADNTDRNYMFTQSKDGTWTAYVQYSYKTDPKYDDDDWSHYEGVEFRIGLDDNGNFYDFYDSSTNTLSRCPKYLDYKNNIATTEPKYALYDKQYTNWLGVDLYAWNVQKIESVDTRNQVFRKSNNDEYREIVNNTEWNAQCIYYDSGNDNYVELYFNDEKYILINDHESTSTNIVEFSLSEVNEIYEANGKKCPVRLYEKTNGLGIVEYGYYESVYYLASGDAGLSPKELTIVSDEKDEIILPEDPAIVIDDCEKLFGDELVEKINDVMDMIKLVIPILLIVFGIIDFTKAIFSDNVDNMAKCQKTFLKRIFAAILVFFAPIFVNLVLSLANEVWDVVIPDTCIKK